MRRTAPAWTIFIALIVGASTMPPGASQGGTVGVTPATLSMDDPPLLPGGSKVATLYFQQQYGEPVQTTIDIVPREGEWGDATAWLTVDRSGTLTIPPGTHEFEVTIDVPSTAANGLYKAGVRFRVAPPGGGDQEGSGATAETAVTSVIGILIDSENEVKRVESKGSAELNDAETGGGLQFSVPLSNTGNVDARPRVKIDIWDKLQTDVLATYWFNDTILKPGESGLRTFVVPAIALPMDQYWAVVSVYLDGALVRTLNAQTFDIVAAGSLARNAELRTIQIAGGITRANVGDLVKLTAIVRNTGQAPLVAQFKGEVWRDGKLVDTLESDPLDIPIADENALDVIYTIEKPGKYEFKGRAHYSNKVTEEKSVMLAVEGDGAGSGSLLLFVGIGALVVLIAAGVLFVAMHNRRRATEARPAKSRRRGPPPGSGARPGRPPQGARPTQRPEQRPPQRPPRGGPQPRRGPPPSAPRPRAPPMPPQRR